MHPQMTQISQIRKGRIALGAAPSAGRMYFFTSVKSADNSSRLFVIFVARLFVVGSVPQIP